MVKGLTQLTGPACNRLISDENASDDRPNVNKITEVRTGIGYHLEIQRMVKELIQLTGPG